MSEGTCPHGIPLKHKDQCTPCWLWEGSDAGKLFVARQRIAELERAAETSRAEHAAAVKRAEEAEAEATEERRLTWEAIVMREEARHNLKQAKAEHAAALAEAESQLFDVRAERDDAREALSEADNRRESEVYEHAAALGLATARIRELEGEREALLELLLMVPSRGIVSGDWFADRRAIVARTEKATKGTT